MSVVEALTAEVIAESIPEAAAEIGCSASHLYRLARAGELPGAYRLGARWFVAVAPFRAHFGEQP